MRGSLALLIALFIEIVLLVLILLVLVIGVLGIFLPILPGLVLVGAAAGIYSLMIKHNYGTVTPRVHRRLVAHREKIFQLPIMQRLMSLITRFQKRKQAKIQELIIQHGLVLFGFNVALIIGFLFGFIGLTIVGTMLSINDVLLAFIPLMAVFIFAAVSAVVWYRYGQLLGKIFPKSQVVSAALVVLLSILPLLVFVILFSAILSIASGLTNEFFVVTFLGLLLLSILAAVFELLLVSLGMLTSPR